MKTIELAVSKGFGMSLLRYMSWGYINDKNEKCVYKQYIGRVNKKRGDILNRLEKILMSICSTLWILIPYIVKKSYEQDCSSKGYFISLTIILITTLMSTIITRKVSKRGKVIKIQKEKIQKIRECTSNSMLFYMAHAFVFALFSNVAVVSVFYVLIVCKEYIDDKPRFNIFLNIYDYSIYELFLNDGTILKYVSNLPNRKLRDLYLVRMSRNSYVRIDK